MPYISHMLPRHPRSCLLCFFGNPFIPLSIHRINILVSALHALTRRMMLLCIKWNQWSFALPIFLKMAIYVHVANYMHYGSRGAGISAHTYRATNSSCKIFVVYSQTCSKRTASRPKVTFPVTSSHGSKHWRSQYQYSVLRASTKCTCT